MNSLTIIIIFLFQFVKLSSSSHLQNGNECEHIILQLLPEDFQPCSEIKYSDATSLCRLEKFDILESNQPLTFIYKGPSSQIKNNQIFDLEAVLRKDYDYVLIAGEIWLQLEDISSNYLTSLQLLISTQKSNEQFTSDLSYSFTFNEQKHISGDLWGIYTFNGLIRGSDSISIRVQIKFNQARIMVKSFKIYQTNQIDRMLASCEKNDSQMIMCSDDKFMFNQVLQQCLFINRCEEGLIESATDHVCMFQCKQGEYVYSIEEEYSICILGHQICDQNDLKNCQVCDKFGTICFRCSEGFTLSENTCIVEQQQNKKEIRILSSPFTGNCDRPQCANCRNGYCYYCIPPFVLFQGTCLLCSRGIQVFGNLDYCRIQAGMNGCSNKLAWSNSEQCKGCLPGLLYPPACGQHYLCANPQFDKPDGTCETCTIPHCLKCRSTIICDECEYGYLFHIPNYYTTSHSVICILSCPSGFNVDTDSALSSLMCRPCPVNCETCDTNRVCTACYPDYSLVASACVLTTFYCPLNCLTCTTNTICDICMSGYARKSDGQCMMCSPSCVTCTETQCTQCHDGSVSPNLTCPAVVCPQSKYLYQTCQNCIANCLTCTDGVSCTDCMPGYVQEMYMCTPCLANCAKCVDVNSCTYCQEGYKLSGTTACIVDTQPIHTGHFYDSASSQYFLCNIYCKHCTNSVGCTTCSNGLIPIGGVCQDCLKNQYLDPAAYECINCAVGCTTCNSSACTACSPTYQLSGGSCIKFSVCGDNNMVDQMYISSAWVTKQCDDTNINNGDGCSSTCQIEAMYTCDRTSGLSVCTLHSSCGDGDFINTMMFGLVKGCDDRNTNNGDGCSSVCQVEASHVCSNDLVNHISTCERYSICGDHDFTHRQIVSSVLETKQCEDWNTINGDGCDSNCRTETNYICTWNPTTLISDCVRHSVCGDGDFSAMQIRSGSYEAKQCDDLNTVSGDGCSSDCQIESNYTCVDSGGNTKNFCELYSVCGDGDKTHTIVESPGVRKSKQCDDGSNIGGDGCSNLCQIETGFVCIEDSMTHLDVCIRVSVCSDGDLVNPMYIGGSFVNKQCDDRNSSSGDGCSNTCQFESMHKCEWDIPQLKSICTRYSACGDGDFTAPLYLSSTYLSKQCDDLNVANGDGCSSTCQLEPSFTCEDNGSQLKSVCSRYSVCGDLDFTLTMVNGAGLRTPKQCDDGNLLDKDGCSSQCMIESGYLCKFDSTILKSVCVKNPVTSKAFTLETKINPDTLNPMVVLRFSNILFKADSLRLRNLVDSQMAAFIKDQMTVQIEDTFADKYSYYVVMHDDQKGFNIEFSAYQNIVNKKLVVHFLQQFQDANNLSNPQFETAFPDTRPIQQEEKKLSDSVAAVGSAVATTFVGSVIPVILFANFSLLFNALDLFQMISYFRFLSPRLPYNMIQFLKMMGQFAVPFKLNFIRPFMEANPVDHICIPQKYVDDSITGVYLDSTGDSISKLLVIGFIHFSLLHLSRLVKGSSQKKHVVQFSTILESKLNTSWKWGWYFNFYWEIYLRLIVGIALQCYGFNMGSFQAVVNTICFVSSIVITLSSPFLFARQLRNNRDKLNESEFRTTWGMLYESLNVKKSRVSSNNHPKTSHNEPIAVQQNSDEEKSISSSSASPEKDHFASKNLEESNGRESSPNLHSEQQLSHAKSSDTIIEETHGKNTMQSYKKYFFLVLYGRKILFGFTVVFFYKFIITQLVLITLYNLIIGALIALIQPYESKCDNVKGFLCEIFMILATCTIYSLIENPPEQDEKERQTVGWYFIVVCGIIVLIQIGFIFSGLVIKLHAVIKEYRQKQKEKKVQPIGDTELQKIESDSLKSPEISVNQASGLEVKNGFEMEKREYLVEEDCSIQGSRHASSSNIQTIRIPIRTKFQKSMIQS